jgi:phospholipid-binding lipoprotein MlaA
MTQRGTAIGALLCVATLAVGCAGPNPNPIDPWQGMNRPVFRFNEGVDQHALRPVARGWKAITTDGVRASIAKFFYNTAFPSRFVSDVGQGDGQQALIEVTRFVVNTTVGVVGLFDPATRWGLPRRDEDAGQMFGRWGIPPGPYWVIPLLGPSNPRDATGMLVDSLLSPFTWIQILTDVPTFGAPTVVNVVNTRARIDERVESARRSALDYYVFMRDAYMQYRASAIKNHGSVSDYGSGAVYDEGRSDELYEIEPGKKE